MSKQSKAGRPAFFGRPMKINLAVRVTDEEHALLQAAAGAELEGAATQADVIRNALAFYFAKHPKAKAIAKRAGDI